MRSGLSDTSPDAQRVLTEVYRCMPPGRKWRQIGRLYADGRLLHAAGVRQRWPTATPCDVLREWLRFGLSCPDVSPAQELVMEPAPQQLANLEDLRSVLTIFDRLGIAHALGGSMASSFYGIPRYTHDADVSVQPFPGREAELASTFGSEYYLSTAAMEDANRRRASFNIINTLTGFKVDVFVCKDDAFETEAFSRRLEFALEPAPAAPMYLHTPEDTLLFKLAWYRLGEEVAREQWQDVLGVLRVQRGRLDEMYLDRWAAYLRVEDLLRAARVEAAL